MANEIEIRLSTEEAWVLFDFVHRFSQTDTLTIEDQAEERALWNLCCIFEKTMQQTNEMEYRDFIELCRSKLRDNC